MSRHRISCARAAVVAGLLLTMASSAPCDTMVSLEPLAEQDLKEPFRQAALTVRNDLSREIRSVALRSLEGGPTLVVSAVIPPKTSARIQLPLPAISAQQVYQVRLLGGEDLSAEPLETAQAALNWPVETINPQRFLDSRYQQVIYDQPSWPGGVLKSITIAAILTVLAMAGALLIRRVALRLAVLVGVTAVATVACWAILSQVELVTHQTAQLPGPTSGPASWAMIIGSRRTTVWSQEGPPLVPLYQTPMEMRQDDMVIRIGQGNTMVLSPTQMRLFLER